MNDKCILAAKLYDDMLENYRNFQDDQCDIDSYDRFLEAARNLSHLGLPNPFADLSGMSFHMNAAIKPTKGKIITAVLEE